MKIQHPLFFLLWSAKLAISATNAPLSTNVVSNYPTCVQRAQCLEYGVQSYCLNDPTIACVCQTQALMFFYFLYGCAIVYGSCSNADVLRTIQLAAAECKSAGYDVNSIINQNNLATPTFSYSISLPTVLQTDLVTNIIGNQLASSSSTPKTTSDVDNSSTKSGLSTGAIIGIVVGGVVVVAIIAGLIVFCMKHRAKQQRLQAMTAPPPPQQPAPAGPPPAPMSQYGSPPPPQGFSPYTAPVYPPQQQPVIQQQQQPLMQGYSELEQPAGYYAPVKKEEYSVTASTATTTTATPAPMPPGQQGQYFQELPAQERPVQVGRGLAEEGHVYSEMPTDGRK